MWTVTSSYPCSVPELLFAAASAFVKNFLTSIFLACNIFLLYCNCCVQFLNWCIPVLHHLIILRTVYAKIWVWIRYIENYLYFCGYGLVQIWCWWYFVAVASVLCGFSMPFSFMSWTSPRVSLSRNYSIVCIYKSPGPLSPLKNLLDPGVYLFVPPVFCSIGLLHKCPSSSMTWGFFFAKPVP